MKLPTLLVDVGATHTRIATESDLAGGVVVKKQPVGGLGELLEFIDAERGGATRIVIGLAAALDADRRGAFFTKWRAHLVVEDLFRRGFEQVLLLNDLECAAWGLVEQLEGLLDAEPVAGFALRAAGEFARAERVAFDELPARGHRVLIAPGTGLGSALLVDLGPDATPRWRPVPCELQHMEVPAHPALDAETLARFGAELGHAPTWEDFVSGRGLVLLDRWARARGGEEAGAGDAFEVLPRTPPREAGAVAAAAAAGEPHASFALAVYHLLLGRYARQLAAASMALGGVFVAGANTAANFAALEQSELLAMFREPSALHGSGMEHVPVVLVPAELNLAGARLVAALGPRATGLQWALRLDR